MKIAIIKDGPFLPIKDGASYKIHSLALEYQKNGLIVYFILIDRGWVTKEEIINSGIKNFILIPPNSVYNSSKITRLLKKLDVNCIQTNIPELILSKSSEWFSFHVIFDSHDVLYEQSVQNKCSQKSISLEKFIDYTAGTLAQTIFCCTERDKRLYQKLGLNGKKIFVVRNGTNIQIKKRYKKEGYVVFVGHMFYEPNYRAVLNIFNIARKIPQVTFKIVGSYPSNLEAKKPSNVKFLGYLKNIVPILAKASVALAPLDAGSGSRIKLLDYLASGLSVISSKIGAEGLEELHSSLIIENDYNKYALLIVHQINNSYFIRPEGFEKYYFNHIGKYAAKIILNRSNCNS